MMEINIRTLRDIVNSFRLTQEQREYLVKSIIAGSNEDIAEELTKINKKLNTKVDKVDGKQLSTNDYTNEDKEKVNIINDKQNITDNTLNTINKTIPGSINELLTLINNNKNIVIFNKETLTYNSAKDAIENNKLIFYFSGTILFFIYKNKTVIDAIELYGGNIYSTFYNSNDKGDINFIVIHIEENDNVNEHITNFTINYGSNDDTVLTTNTKTVELIKRKLKYSILKLGNGLAWDTNDLINNTINITLDTNVFFVAEFVPASPTDNQKKKICLVPAETSEEGNYYTEYVWVVDDEHPDGYWEEFGTYKSEVDLTPYLKIADAKSTYATKSEFSSHTGNTKNPHSVTKAQVGLGNVDNTSDANKPVSTAQQAAIDAVNDKTAVITQVPTLVADYIIPVNDTSREYIYEISVGETVYNITGAEGIKWADGVTPIATANSTIVVSVMNNLAVWGTF